MTKIAIMSYGELYLPPVWTGIDAKNGRFLKGHVPANKGKRWDEYMSKCSQRRSARGWKKLDLYRCKGGGGKGGRPKKPVVAVMDDGTFTVFSYTGRAAQCLGGCRHNVARCCRLNAMHGANTDHRYKGLRLYYESDTVWINKVRQ